MTDRDPWDEFRAAWTDLKRTLWRERWAFGVYVLLLWTAALVFGVLTHWRIP